MKTLIVGAGEVGISLYNILKKHYEIYIIDKDNEYDKSVEILHITFPWSDKFEEAVKNYQKEYKPKFTVIHSTVPVGTSKKLKAIHSPVIGIHPHLEQSLKTFTKFLGGEQASQVADYFRRAGMKVYLFDKSETTELMKILDTTHYGMEIEYTKEIKRQCDKFGIPFEAWTLWVENYNEGYEKLGYPEYCKPKLVPIMAKQGGHCVLQNCELLNNAFTKFLKELNEIPSEDNSSNELIEQLLKNANEGKISLAMSESKYPSGELINFNYATVYKDSKGKIQSHLWLLFEDNRLMGHEGHTWEILKTQKEDIMKIVKVVDSISVKSDVDVFKKYINENTKFKIVDPLY